MGDLMQEMERRRGMVGGLHDRRTALERELETLQAEIAELESLGSLNGHSIRRGPGRPKGSANAHGGRGGAGRGRGGNEKSLAARLEDVLRGRAMNVAQMVEAVKKAGHKSKSKNFKTIVGLALLKHKKLFRRVSRGQYTAA